MDRNILDEIIVLHGKWLLGSPAGSRADLRGGDLTRADLTGADLRKADLRGAFLNGAILTRAVLTRAVLCHADMSNTILHHTDLSHADLRHANLSHAILHHTDLSHADLRHANFLDAVLVHAYLDHANLNDAKNMVKIMGVEPGNHYWKAIGDNLRNGGYQFKLGLNELPEGEVFTDDDREVCSYPGFHFASKSWCKAYYSERRYLCKIRIPEDAQINEPWATDGKASADKIEIVQIFCMKTGKNLTPDFLEVADNGK